MMIKLQVHHNIMDNFAHVNLLNLIISCLTLIEVYISLYIHRCAKVLFNSNFKKILLG